MQSKLDMALRIHQKKLGESDRGSFEGMVVRLVSRSHQSTIANIIFSTCVEPSHIFWVWIDLHFAKDQRNLHRIVFSMHLLMILPHGLLASILQHSE